MTLSNLKYHHLAIIVFSLRFLPKLISNFFGEYSFIIAYYENRVYGGLVLLLFILMIKKIPISFYAILGMCVIYSLLIENSITNIITEIVLFICPVSIYILLSTQKEISSQYIYKFSEYYYKINLIVFPIYVLSRFMGFAVFCDVFYLFAFQLFRIIVRKNVMEKVYLMFFTIAGISKSFVITLFLLFFSYLFKSKTFIQGIAFLFLFLIFISSFYMELSSLNSSFKRGVELIEKTNFPELFSIPTMLTLNKNPVYVFELTDMSSAHRLYEFFRVVQTINENFFTFVFGKGLGGGINLSNTLDGSVLGSHQEGVNDVRVVHLGLSYVLLKFGWLGLIIFIAGSIVMIRKILLNILQRKSDTLYVYSILFLILYVNAFFTFGSYAKLPMVGICIFVLMNYKKMQEKQIC
jgi:hypothetical protein